MLGPSLGTSATTLWGACAARPDRRASTWSPGTCPGHGHNRVGARGAVHDGRAGRRRAARRRRHPRRSAATRRLVLLRRRLGRRRGRPAAAARRARRGSTPRCCSAPARRSAPPELWAERIGQVRASGTPVHGDRLRRALVRPRLPRARARPGLGAAARAVRHRRRGLRPGLRRARRRSTSATGSARSARRCSRSPAAQDVATPPDKLREIADGVQDGRYVELPGVAHLAPGRGARGGRRPAPRALPGRGRRAATTSAGMTVRREVLGDAHVDRAIAGTTDLTRDFQELITAYAWGEIWTRPGLDRRSRSMITLTALVARGTTRSWRCTCAPRCRNGLTRRGDQGGAAADRHLLRRPRRQHGLPDRPAEVLDRGRTRMTSAYRVRRRPHAVRPLRRRARRGPPRRPRRDRAHAACWRRRPASTRPRSATSCGATPTRPARTTATSAGWRCCSPGCRCRCRRRR